MGCVPGWPSSSRSSTPPEPRAGPGCGLSPAADALSTDAACGRCPACSPTEDTLAMPHEQDQRRSSGCRAATMRSWSPARSRARRGSSSSTRRGAGSRRCSWPPGCAPSASWRSSPTSRLGCPLIDTRLPKYLVHGTLPSARGIPHTEIAERLGEIDAEIDTILFCNGPQCAATPDAIRGLLDAGHPPERLLYYRGGIHDWVTLGLAARVDTLSRERVSTRPGAGDPAACRRGR